MAQEDKGLVARGIILLAIIGTLVTFVLAVIFWRPQAPVATSDDPLAPERYIAGLLAPPAGGFPSHISWPTVFKLSQELPSEQGWEVRYNAAATLARRGSMQTPWPILREMLDEKQQLRNHRSRMPDGRVVYDEAAARTPRVSAMKAIAAWHEKHADTRPTPPAELRELYSIIDDLAQSPHEELKVNAEKARATFFR